MIGDAANYVGKLSEEQRERSHWVVAIRMLDHALREPRYLKTATISFQTALAMDSVLVTPASDFLKGAGTAQLQCVAGRNILH